MNELTITQQNLPVDLKGLQQFILIGEEVLKAHEAKIRAISKLPDAQSAKEAAVKDGQSIGEAILWAKAKVGELLLGTEKKGKTKEYGSSGGTIPTLPPGITKKQSHFYQQLHKNRDVIQEVIIEAAENEDLPTTRETLKRIQKKNQQQEYQNKVSIIPPGKFRTIVVDPPWPIEKIIRKERPYQDRFDYARMSLDEIKDLPIADKADEHCHLYLWTTHKHLPHTFEILSAWGFKYQCVLTWIKNVGFTPFSWMYSTELALFAHRGNLDLLAKETSVIRAIGMNFLSIIPLSSVKFYE